MVTPLETLDIPTTSPCYFFGRVDHNITLSGDLRPQTVCYTTDKIDHHSGLFTHQVEASASLSYDIFWHQDYCEI